MKESSSHDDSPIELGLISGNQSAHALMTHCYFQCPGRAMDSYVGLSG